MQPARQMGQPLVFGHKGQVLPKRPPDRRKPRGRRVMDPARQRHQEQRSIEQPVHDLSQRRLKRFVPVQQLRLGLAQRPEDPDQGQKENRHTDGFMQRKQQHRARHDRLIAREIRRPDLVGKAICDDSQRNNGENQ